ncbi:MAG: SPASM domain-containing protein [Bacillota bacterium]|nr:SPASM domain-containing protein [Bacillota bacterium]
MRFKRIYVEITNICNMNCSFCPTLLRSPREMSPFEFEKVLSEIKNHTNCIYLHVKGEPLSHSEIDNILTICDNNEVKVNITTNGTLLPRRLEMLKMHPSVRQINISLHSQESFKILESYINNIIKSADILSKYTMISMRIWTYDKCSETNAYILRQLAEHYKTKIDLCQKRSVLSNNIFFSLGETFEWPSENGNYVSDTGYCLGTRSQVAILSDGTVVPCCLDAEGAVAFGNMFEQSFVEIINSQRFKDMNNSLNSRRLTEKLCKNCSYRKRFD